jgi:Ca2+-binding RTX toxin-like protein
VATFDGQAGINTLDLSHISADATVNLVAGTATSAQTSAATLVSIQNVVSGLGNDTIVGDANANVFFATAGGDGNDSYTGGGGTDTYDLSLTAAGAIVNLGAGTSKSADTGTDTLSGIANVVGSQGNDLFIASVGDGNNSYTGGLGVDTYDLSATAAAATVNLATGVSTSTDTGSDTLAGIENVVGGSGADTITGDGNDNVITGGAGNDTVVGGAGNDTFIATVGDGNDSYNGGTGINTYDLSATTANATVNLNQATASSLDIGTDTLALNTIQNVTGGSGNDNIAGNAQNNVLIGGAGNDTLTANGGVDTMLGGLGNDSYVVDNAADVVTEAVGQGNDTVFAMVSYALQAGSEVETMRVNVTTGLTLTGNEFNNTIIGNTGNDTLFGGAGNDVLSGLAGADTMSGGTGNDTYTVDNAGDLVLENVGEGTDTVNTSVSYALAAGSEVEILNGTGSAALTLTGNEFNNTITGTGANDTLFGGAGNDTLNGGAGADTMSGGIGNDTYTVDNTNDVVLENAGEGTDTVNTSVNYTLAAASEVEFLTATTNANLTLTGNEFNNTITSGNGNDTLTGGAGNDTLNAGGGNDRLVATVNDGNDAYIGGAGTDTYDLSGTSAGATVNLGLGTSTSAQTGTDTLSGIENVTGSSGNDTFVASSGDGNNAYNGGLGADTYDLSGTTAAATVLLAQGTATSAQTGNDTLTGIENVTGGSGNDTLGGDAQNNVLIGGAGNDVLNGNAGADTMIGSLGDDSYFVDNAGDVVTEAAGQGTDTVFASVNYSLSAGQEIEFLRANAGATGLALTGNEFANRLVGGVGNDTLDGGTGNDSLGGGGGNDIFKFSPLPGGSPANFNNPVFGQDTITDFTAHAGAAANLDLIDISGLGITLANFNTYVSIGSVGTNALIQFHGIVGSGGGGGATANSITVLNDKGLIDITDFRLA